MKKQIFLIILAYLLLISCNFFQGDSIEKVDLNISLSLGTVVAKTYTQTIADVNNVRVTCVDQDWPEYVIDPVWLLDGDMDGFWDGTVIDLVVGHSVEITVRGYSTYSASNPDNGVIFEEVRTEVITSSPNYSFSLAPVDNGDPFEFPKIVSIYAPGQDSGMPMTTQDRIVISVEGIPGGTFDFELSANEVGNGFSATGTGAVNPYLDSVSGGLIECYFHLEAGTGSDTITVTVTNSQGNSVTTSFTILIEPAA